MKIEERIKKIANGIKPYKVTVSKYPLSCGYIFVSHLTNNRISSIYFDELNLRDEDIDSWIDKKYSKYTLTATIEAIQGICDYTSTNT